MFFDTKDLHAAEGVENVITEHDIMFTALGIPTKALRSRLVG